MEASQRERIYAAMVDACARHGYAATTARELVALANLSTSTLYKLFGSKEDCFLATFDNVVEQAALRISIAYRSAPEADRDWMSGLCRAFETFAAELVERPGSSHLALIDVLAAGPAAVERVEQAEDLFVGMIHRSLSHAPDGLAISPDLVRAVIGGVWFVARRRLVEGEAESLASSGAELLAWMLSYRSAQSVPLVTLPAGASFASDDERRRRIRVGSERTKILRAAAVLIGDGGYGTLSEAAIAELAEISPSDFFSYFEDVSQCFYATLEFLSAEALVTALRACEDVPSWAHGTYRAVAALFQRVAEDPALARAAFLDAFAAGPAGTERRAAVMRGLADMFIRRAPHERRPTPLVAEAIVGAVWSLAHRQVAKGQAHRLPALSARGAFLALAPIVGPDIALATIEAETKATDEVVGEEPVGAAVAV